MQYKGDIKRDKEERGIPARLRAYKSKYKNNIKWNLAATTAAKKKARTDSSISDLKHYAYQMIQLLNFKDTTRNTNSNTNTNALWFDFD